MVEKNCSQESHRLMLCLTFIGIVTQENVHSLSVFNSLVLLLELYCAPYRMYLIFNISLLYFVCPISEVLRIRDHLVENLFCFEPVHELSQNNECNFLDHFVASRVLSLNLPTYHLLVRTSSCRRNLLVLLNTFLAQQFWFLYELHLGFQNTKVHVQPLVTVNAKTIKMCWNRLFSGHLFILVLKYIFYHSSST